MDSNRRLFIKYWEFCDKEKLKILQHEFMATMNLPNIKSIAIYSEDSCDMVDYRIETNTHVFRKEQIEKKIFEILYTEPHYIEFLDGIKIIHFIHL